MCLAVPGRVEEVRGRKAVVAYGSEKRHAILTDELKVAKGDFVLVQMGCVVQKLSRKEAKESIRAWESANKANEA